MQITKEDVTYGYEGNPNDGVLGADENLYFQAEGTLGPGESYTYQYHEQSWGARLVRAQFGGKRNLNLRFRMEMLIHFPDKPDELLVSEGVVVSPGVMKGCLATNWSNSLADVKFTMSNLDANRPARSVSLWGQDFFNLGQFSCDEWLAV